MEAHIRIVELLADDAQWKLADARHWAAALRGKTTGAAPEKFVSDVFDDYAENFDNHLVNVLKYQTPQLLKEQLAMILRASDGRLSLGRVLDLGCGTGLMGHLVRELGPVDCLEGVDLSANMLEKARMKGSYDVLRNGNLEQAFVPRAAACVGTGLATDFMPDANDLFGLIVATDVFGYVGNLSRVFQFVRRWIQPRGIFGFSVEEASDGQQMSESVGYRLMKTGRYTHTLRYIRGLAAENDFNISLNKAANLRYEKGIPVCGRLFVLTPQRESLFAHKLHSGYVECSILYLIALSSFMLVCMLGNFRELWKRTWALQMPLTASL
eukprot:gnl/MRDRNA2_/MRDRNA2_242702_c0_seq1.p1 gnl/MRDRNA2_/MRDRNA2_242702_c0~~gnl/MRDRNA2_/MRDRNA2_242702_c0_seq1.p1  ORF type:complete len:377 (+),score=57.37 gnl/MRDRNA2_/MRDRNA2_242702_c0_seq1:159-1133(+)